MRTSALVVLITAALIVISGLGAYFFFSRSDHTSPAPSADSLVNSVSPREFDQLAASSSVFLLDVHTPEQTHIPGTDAFIPYDQITARIDQLPVDKSTPILVYCRSGNMSAQAAAAIAAAGYTRVYDLAGGSDAYRESHAGVFLTPKSHQLGTVVYGDVATSSFTLTNYSPLPLHISHISTSCGCTRAFTDSDTLAAYSAVPVHVSFDPAVHKDDTDLGDITRTVYIDTDNPDFPQLTAIITATVIKQ